MLSKRVNMATIFVSLIDRWNGLIYCTGEYLVEYADGGLGRICKWCYKGGDMLMMFLGRYANDVESHAWIKGTMSNVAYNSLGILRPHKHASAHEHTQINLYADWNPGMLRRKKHNSLQKMNGFIPAIQWPIRGRLSGSYLGHDFMFWIVLGV